MEVERGETYRVLEYPNLGMPDLHKVKVSKLYVLPSGQEIIEYVYNYPFPIRKHVNKEDFVKWIAKEKEE
jgi:hypothetical protein